jgi:murein DD-endopeptidase MepM/ murein hydrolase activator NlpD
MRVQPRIQDRREQGAPRGVASWTATLAEQQAEIKELKAELQRRVDAGRHAHRPDDAHVIRLDALGKRLTQMANIDNREFDFESQPAIGGPESDLGAAMQAPDLNDLLGNSNRRSPRATPSWRRSRNALLSKKLDEQIRPTAARCSEGHISSYFGERQDPFTATRRSTRASISRAARARTSLPSPPAWSPSPARRPATATSSRSATGNGLVTRYGHNQALAVGVGRTVARGDTLASSAHRPLDGPARALRSAQERPPDRPAELHRR